MKSPPTFLHIGNVVAHEPRIATSTTQRWRRQNASTPEYTRWIGRKIKSLSRVNIVSRRTKVDLRDALPSSFGIGSMRAAIIGVSENATSIETPIANAIVSPKL